MKNMLVMGIIFVALFGASAAVSWMMIPQPEPVAETDETGETPTQVSANELESMAEFQHTEELPVVFRPQDVTADTLLKMADMLKKREDALKVNERRIEEQQSRMEFVFQDMQRERVELDALHDRIADRIQQASGLIQQLQSEHRKLGEQQEQTETELKEFKKDLAKMDEAEQANIAKLAEFYQDMPEETAARYLRELCDNGKIDLAASVLDTLEKRVATKILVALDDPVLVSQLMEKIKQRPASETARRSDRSDRRTRR